MEQLKQLMLAQFREFYRNPGIIFWAMFFPILMATGLGMAFTVDKEVHHKVPIVNGDELTNYGGMEDGQTLLIDSMQANKVYAEFYISDIEHVTHQLKDGEILLYLDYGLGGNPAVMFDPNNAEAMLLSYQLNGYLGRSKLSENKLDRQVITNHGSRYVDFLVPGLLGMGIMMSCMWGVSYSLIDKRGKKLLRRMIATPMSKSMFLLSHLLGRLVLSTVEGVVLLVFSALVFDFSNAGPWWPILVTYTAANLAFTGIAVLVSSRTENTQVGNGLINVVVMPMMIMSGVFFSYKNFPESVANVLSWLPLTAAVDNFRDVFLVGSIGPEFWTRIAALFVVGSVTFLVGQKVYKWY